MLFQPHNNLVLALSLGLLASACSAAMRDPAPSESDRPLASKRMEKSVTVPDSPPSVRFATLDDYLSHLELIQGPVDGPWYKEISPGLYQLQTGNLKLDGPGEQQTTFTRDELKKKFGFAK